MAVSAHRPRPVAGRPLARRGRGAGGVFVFDLPAAAFAGAMPSDRDAEVRSLRWSPDRPWVASVDADGFLAVRDWPEGEVVEERRIDESVVESVRWLPDGKALLVATLGGAVRLWPLGGEPVDFAETHPEPVLALAVLPGGERLVSADALGNVWLWDIAARKRIENAWTKADDAVDTVAVNHAGDKVLVTGNGGILYIYDLVTPGEPVAHRSRQPADRRRGVEPGRFADRRGRYRGQPQGLVARRERADGDGPHLPGRAGRRRGRGGRRRRPSPPHALAARSSAVAIATSAGEVVVVAIDETAWLARARSVFGIAAPVEQTAPAGRWRRPRPS